MALWDTATEAKKCGSCGGNLVYDSSLKKTVCRSCGNLFDPSSMKSVGNLEIRDSKPATEEEEGKMEFVCDGCGAVVVTDSTTAATFCAFCGSPTLIRRRLNNEFRPDFIIPFKITKEEAEQKFLDYVKANKYVPSDFVNKSKLSKITGIYVPFWLLDADCHTDVAGSGTIIDGEVKTVFNIDRTINFKVSKVPFDGSKKISNMLMESIEPYDYSEMEYYNDNYIPGFYAQRYDESALDMTERIRSRLDSHARQLGKYVTASEYNTVSVSCNASTSSNYSQLYAMFPVWFLRYEYKGLFYSYAVNGQTGKAGGSIPYSNFKRYTSIFFTAAGWLSIPLALILLGIGWLVFLLLRGSSFDEFSTLAQMTIYLGAVFLPTLIGIVIHKIKKISFESTNPLESAPEVDEYIDFKSKVDMEKRDSFGFVTKIEKDSDKDTLSKLFGL